MFEPPPGFIDLLSDAGQAPIRTTIEDLVIPVVGTVRARRPEPRSLAELAMIHRQRTTAQDTLEHVHTFVCDHLEAGQLDELLYRMVTENIPEDTLGIVARSIITWGTARPYRAVMTLASLAGREWRTIRTHLISQGIADPMALPSMHILLDVIETMIVEGMQDRSPEATKRKRQQFYDRLYRPERPVDTGADPVGPLPAPSGFSPEEQEAAFDQFAKAAPR